MAKHTHRLKYATFRAYRGPVASHENRAAHGGHTEVATCRCGAVRLTNRNQGHTEMGSWDYPIIPGGLGEGMSRSG